MTDAVSQNIFLKINQFMSTYLPPPQLSIEILYREEVGLDTP
jgi:hypothetical protein